MYVRRHEVDETDRRHRRPSVLAQAEACGRPTLLGAELAFDDQGWVLTQAGEVTHRTLLSPGSRSVDVVLGGTVFRVGSEVLALHEAALYAIPGVPDGRLIELDGRIYLDEDGRHELRGLAEARRSAIAGAPLPRVRDVRAFAVASTNPDDLARLRAGAADPERRDQRLREGRTWLHTAAAYGNVAAVRILLDAGADVWARDAKGNDVARSALCTESTEVLDVLWEAGLRFADPIDALLEAVACSVPAMVEWCLAHGLGDPVALDLAFAQPKHWKRPESKQRIIDLLVGAGLERDSSEPPADPGLAAVHAATAVAGVVSRPVVPLRPARRA